MWGEGTAEGKHHQKVKQRLFQLFERYGIAAKLEHIVSISVDNGRSTKQTIDYIYDIYFDTAHFGVDIEIDGTVGHTTAQALGQDRHRDVSSSSAQYPIATIRYPTNLLAGSDQYRDGQIMEDIEWQLNELGFDGAAIYEFKKDGAKTNV